MLSKICRVMLGSFRTLVGMPHELQRDPQIGHRLAGSSFVAVGSMIGASTMEQD